MTNYFEEQARQEFRMMLGMGISLKSLESYENEYISKRILELQKKSKSN